MEIIVQLILLLAFLKYCLKSALTGNAIAMGTYALLGSLLAFFIYPYIIELPTDMVSQLLKDTKRVSNWAVISTIEAVVGIFLSVSLIGNFFKSRKEKKKKLFFLRIIPGVLFCVSIAYFELLFFKHNTSGSFRQTAFVYSGIVFASIFSVSLFLKYFIGDRMMKLELKMLLNLAILSIGLILNASIADYNISNATYRLSLFPLVSFAVLVVLSCLAGFILYKTDFQSKITNKIWNKSQTRSIGSPRDC